MIQFFKETERICETERLQHLVRESWEKSWSNRIVEQANLEKESNSRLRDLMDSLKGTVIYMWQSQVENEHYSTLSGLIR